MQDKAAIEGKPFCKLSEYEHNKSIFNLGQCQSCFSDKVIDYSPSPVQGMGKEGWREVIREVDEYLSQTHYINKKFVGFIEWQKLKQQTS